MVMRIRPTLLVAAVFALLGAGAWLFVPQRAEAPVVSPAKTNINTHAAQTSSDDRAFFSYYRIQRDKVRCQQLKLLQDIVSNKRTDTESRQAAFRRMLAITDRMELELKAEGVLKAAGMKDGVVIARDQAATVILPKSKISHDEMAELKNQIAGVLNLDEKQMKIIVNP